MQGVMGWNPSTSFLRAVLGVVYLFALRLPSYLVVKMFLLITERVKQNSCLEPCDVCACSCHLRQYNVYHEFHSSISTGQ